MASSFACRRLRLGILPFLTEMGLDWAGSKERSFALVGFLVVSPVSFRSRYFLKMAICGADFESDCGRSELNVWVRFY